MERRRIETDVLVAGGGSAGSAAAIAAARTGARVLLVEETNSLGGTSTTGAVHEWFAWPDGLGNVFDDVHAELKSYGATCRYVRPSGEAGDAMFFNGEVLKIVWQLLAERAGVDLLLHASVIDVKAEAGRALSATVASCSRLIDVDAAMFIDTTGEGDLAALAGAEFEQGDPERHHTLQMSLCFHLYDTGAPVTPYLPEGLDEIHTTQDLPGLHVAVKLPDGRVYCNMTSVIEHDPTDPLSLTAAEVEARKQLARTVHFLQKERYPTHALASSGARIGIREGRRIVGDYRLTIDEILGDTPTDFPDGVAVATSQIDFHSLTRGGVLGWREAVHPYAIPLRAMTARGFANLLMAGKCISGDQAAMSSYRMTPTCCAMGQAVGTAAALAVKAGATDVRDVDIAALRDTLRADGMELDPTQHKPFAPVIKGGKEESE